MLVSLVQSWVAGTLRHNENYCEITDSWFLGGTAVQPLSLYTFQTPLLRPEPKGKEGVG